MEQEREWKPILIDGVLYYKCPSCGTTHRYDEVVMVDDDYAMCVLCGTESKF